MTKKILAILVAAFMMIAVLAAVVAANTDSDASPQYTLPACDVCFHGYCLECVEFVLAHYEGYHAASLAFVNLLHPAMFVDAAAYLGFADAVEDVIETVYDYDLSILEEVQLLAALAEEYMTPQAIAFGVEFSRTMYLAEFFSHSSFDDFFWESRDAIALLVAQGDIEGATTAVIALNDELVVLVEALDLGIEIPQFLRSTPAATPVCPVDPDATVCLCDDVTTTAPQDTTTAADTTVNGETTTVADTTVNGETTTVADTTVNGETTTEAETTTAPPAEGGTNWGSIAGIIGIVVLVIVNLVAIFGFVRILFNA
ncbi:MAG: hypothetical protein FWB76_05010 [Oscillospiraceae bacterium]|nr:hypothetical protein [Oscillospiraceae bacterium]